MRRYSRAAMKRVTEPWEEYVGYPYDDLVPKQRGSDGKLHYPEWTGGAARGTVTIGFGHTDAAGNLKIEPGMRLTREEAEDLALKDIGPCEAAVNRLLKVEVTQHQFDMLTDTYFNCPAASIAAIKLYNAGQPEAVPAKLLQYVSARDKRTNQLVRMQGLVNRRNAEIAWGNTPDEVEPDSSSGIAAPNPEVVFAPKAERNDPPKSILSSKTVAAGGTLATASLAEAADAFNQVLEPLKQVKGSLAELGLSDQLLLAAHDPKFLIATLAVGLAIFIIGDRVTKLWVHHV
jgi:GH24 family phage-related lysozyme (muramidase)